MWHCEITGPEGLIAVFDHLACKLPKGVMLHGFGVKGTALSHLKGIEHRIASIDSQAYGQAARHDAFARGVAKTDTLVAQHLQAWTASQFARLRGSAEIGRAAGREKGCQYVWISVVAVPVKKT